MNNIKIADDRASRLKKLVLEFSDKAIIVLPITHTMEYLQCLDRLRFLERMLQNLNNNYYEMQNATDK